MTRPRSVRTRGIDCPGRTVVSRRVHAIGRAVALVTAVPLVVLSPNEARAQAIPDDSVRTVFVSDTIDGYGAVGGVVVDGLGYVYVADFRNAVWRISPDGGVEKFADGLYGASGNAIGPRGFLFQSSFNGNYVSRISRAGEVETWVDEGLNGPVGIAASPDGDLFVVNCNAGSVSRVAPDRTVHEHASGELFTCPNGITFDDRGDLYVVNFGNTKVVRITPDGVASEFTDIPGAGGNGHIVFASGVFYVTKFRGHQIYRVQRDGSFSVLAGTGRAGRSDGSTAEASFTRPNGIGASPSGTTLWVNDLTEGTGLGQGVSLVSMRRVDIVTLTDYLTSLGPDADAEEIRAAYAAFRVSRPDEASSAAAIALGYQWMTAGRVGAGVALFELNAGTFPSDANAQFHYGEAHRYTGSPEQAADQYRKVLELAPDHPTAAARLAEVTSG